MGPSQGSGLLPWSWAEERLASSHDYWLTTTWPDGRPHLMPVWGMWHESCVWFSSSGRSRKTLNLERDPRCTVATDKASEPVIVEGVAEVVKDLVVLATVLDLENRKYNTSYTMEMLDPATSACFRIRPLWAFGLSGDDFTGSPTRWVFGTELTGRR